MAKQNRLCKGRGASIGGHRPHGMQARALQRGFLLATAEDVLGTPPALTRVITNSEWAFTACGQHLTGVCIGWPDLQAGHHLDGSFL